MTASKRDLVFINKAMQIAMISPCLHQHGCVLVRNGKIISNGYNNYGTSFYSHSCNSTHAEIDALGQCLKEKCCFQTQQEPYFKED